MPEKAIEDEFRQIVSDRGSCLATNSVTAAGARIGFMYREPADDAHDSGWRFVASSDSDEFCADADNWSICDVNRIANLDAGIVRFLDQPVGSVYERDGSGKLVRWSKCSVAEAKVFTIPDADGESVLDAHWVADFPVRFKRRIEDTNTILWRPGFTIWMQGFGTRAESAQQVRSKMEREIPGSASDLSREEEGGLWRTSFRIASSVPDGRRPALVALIWANGQLLNLTAYFDDEADAAQALAISRSVRPRST
jgi:hypothetical protein